MDSKCFIRTLQVAAVAVTLAAILQELEKPREERTWHGKVGFIPYDFRLPSIGRIKESYWNPYSPHILSPIVFGVGWAVNFHTLLENLGLITQTVTTEQDFLMPSKKMKEILTHPQTET